MIHNHLGNPLMMPMHCQDTQPMRHRARCDPEALDGMRVLARQRELRITAYLYGRIIV